MLELVDGGGALAEGGQGAASEERLVGRGRQRLEQLQGFGGASRAEQRLAETQLRRRGYGCITRRSERAEEVGGRGVVTVALQRGRGGERLLLLLAAGRCRRRDGSGWRHLASQSGDLDPAGSRLGLDVDGRDRIERGAVRQAVGDAACQQAAQHGASAFEVDLLQEDVGIVGTGAHEPAVDQSLGGTQRGEGDLGTAVEAAQPIGEQPGLLLDRERGTERVDILGTEAAARFLGMERAHSGQAASAAGGIVGPRIELCGLTGRALQQQWVEAVAVGDTVVQLGERSRVRELAQRRRRILGRLDRGGGHGRVAQARGGTDEAEISETLGERGQSVGAVGVALEQLVNFPVGFADQAERGQSQGAGKRGIVGHAGIGGGEILVTAGQPVLERLVRACRELAEEGGSAQRVVARRSDLRGLLEAGAGVGVAAKSLKGFGAPVEGAADIVRGQVIAAGDQAVPGCDRLSVGAANESRQAQAKAGVGGGVEAWKAAEEARVALFGLVRLAQALECLTTFEEGLRGELGVLVGIVGDGVELAQGAGLVARSKAGQRFVESGGCGVGAVRLRLQIAVEGCDGVAVIDGEVPGAAEDEGVDLVGRLQLIEEPQGIGGGGGAGELVQRGLEGADRFIAFAKVAADLGQAEQLLAEGGVVGGEGEDLAVGVESLLVLAEASQRLCSDLEEALLELSGLGLVQASGGCFRGLRWAAGGLLCFGDFEVHRGRRGGVGGGVGVQRRHGFAVAVAGFQGLALQVGRAWIRLQSRGYVERLRALAGFRENER